jgi:putative thioredoxin
MARRNFRPGQAFMEAQQSLIFDVGLEDFDQRVLAASADQAVLVDFWAEWCPPCIVLAPVIERVVREHAGVLRLAKLEVDEGENMKLAGRYQVRGFPTVIIFRDGAELGRFAGAKSYTDLVAFLQRHVGPLPA